MHRLRKRRGCGQGARGWLLVYYNLRGTRLSIVVWSGAEQLYNMELSLLRSGNVKCVSLPPHQCEVPSKLIVDRLDPQVTDSAVPFSHRHTQVGQDFIDLRQAKCAATVTANPANASSISASVDKPVPLNILAEIGIGQ